MRILITHLIFALVVSLLLWLTHNPAVSESDLFLDLIAWYGFQVSAFVFWAVFELVYYVHLFFFPPRSSDMEFAA